MLECPAGLMILQNQPTAAPAFHGSVAGSGSGQIHMIHSMAGLRIRIRSDPYDLLHGRVADSDPVGSIRLSPLQGCGFGSDQINAIHSMTGLWIRIRSDPYDSLYDRVVDQDQVGSIRFTPWQGYGSESDRIHMIHSMTGLWIKIRSDSYDSLHGRVAYSDPVEYIRCFPSVFYDSDPYKPTLRTAYMDRVGWPIILHRSWYRIRIRHC